MTTNMNACRLLPVILLIIPGFLQAQVPVDESGQIIGQVSTGAEVMPLGEGDIPRLSAFELQELVGPVALYPDDLLAVVLPASAYPLQIAAAARFLEARENDPALEPNPEWDDSVIALLNYPEVIALMNEDLDWTYRLGEAVVAQQADVVAAVEAFRDRVYAAGNLKSDEYQTVEHRDDVIRITPVSEDVIYVPYYEPERVVVYQPRPVYYYYPRPCPVYYYPYSSSYHFDRGYFWGVTTAFTLGWHSNSLNVYHHSYRGHPYYGRHYRDYWWYRRPSINIYNTTYVTNHNRNAHVNVRRNVNIDRGDLWHPRSDRREYIIREGYSDRSRTTTPRATTTRTVATRNVQPTRTTRERQPEPIRFRDREFVDDTWTTNDRRGTRTVTRTNTERSKKSTRTTRTSGTTPQRRYTPPTTVREKRVTRPTDTRRQEPARTTRQQPSRTVRAEPPRTTRTAPTRSTRQEPPRREASRPQRQERAAPQRQSRSSGPRSETRERRSHRRK